MREPSIGQGKHASVARAAATASTPHVTAQPRPTGLVPTRLVPTRPIPFKGPGYGNVAASRADKRSISNLLLY
jgi:hypothetical protein